MPVTKMLELSIAHITAEDDEILGGGIPAGYRDICPRVVPHDNGYFVSVPTEDAAEAYGGLREIGLSDTLVDVLKRAAKLKCAWVYLDSDGPIDRFLPQR